MNRYFLALLCLPFLAACSDNNDNPIHAEVRPDFTAADAWMSDFVDSEDAFPGGSYIVVDREQGVVHKAVFGNQTEDSLVLLASTSKVPTVTLLMALHDDDENVDFDITTPIANYLPWMGVWDPAITTEHLVSNRSGIPGLINLFIDQASLRAAPVPVPALRHPAGLRGDHIHLPASGPREHPGQHRLRLRRQPVAAVRGGGRDCRRRHLEPALG